MNASSAPTGAAPPPPPPPRPAAWKQVLLGLVILVSGIVLGVSGALWLAPRKLSPPSFEPRRFTDLMTRRMGPQLQLTPEQAQQIRGIVRKHMRAIDKIREETRPRIVKEFETMKQEVASRLDKDQQRIWNEQFNRLHRFGPFHGFRGGRGGPPGRGHGPPAERKVQPRGRPSGPPPWRGRRGGFRPRARWAPPPSPDGSNPPVTKSEPKGK